MGFAPVLTNNDDLYKLPPLEIYDKFREEFFVEMPEDISSVADLEIAVHLLGKLNSYREYLDSLCVQFDIRTREAKRDAGKENKSIYEDMIDRKKVVSSFAEIINNNISTLSRMITIYQMILKELNVNTAY